MSALPAMMARVQDTCGTAGSHLFVQKADTHQISPYLRVLHLCNALTN